MFFQDLETDRLLLRGISDEDGEFIFEQFSDPSVCQYLFDAEPFTDRREAEELIDFFRQPEPRGQHRWILIRKADEAKMGTCGFHCWNQSDGTTDTGYDLREEYRGKGYMAEAMGKIIEFAKEHMQVRSIRAVIYVGNPRSIALVQRLGFEQSGETFEVFRGEKIPHHLYTLNCSAGGTDE